MAVVVLLLVIGVAAPASAARPRVTVFGDSVQASFLFTPQAVQILRPGLDLQLQTSVCRKLTGPGCLGGRPESVLALATGLGSRLGDVVIVHVGYNDSASAYEIQKVLEAFRRAGVRAVVWVTLRERHRHYASTNARIRDAARRAARRGGTSIIRVADWNTASVGRPWFASDGIHLNSAGAIGLAGLLRRSVAGALAEIGTPLRGPAVTIAADRFTLGGRARGLAGDPDTLWVEAGGTLRALTTATARPRRRPLRLRPTETLISDGRGAWLVDPRNGTIMQARHRRGGRDPIRGVGVSPQIARSGGALWVLTRCDTTDPACTEGTSLQRRVARTGLSTRLEGTPTTVRAIAADAQGMWSLSAGPASGTSSVGLHAPVTGRLVRSTVLRAPSEGVAVSAGGAGAWVRHRNGALTLVHRNGRARVVARGVAAVGTRGDQVWVVTRDRRRLLSLHPRTGRVRARVRSDRPLSTRMTFTRHHLWVLTRSGREVLRVRRP